jgi:hypothetical protein
VLAIGSLFSGIGGLEYRLELTGKFKTIWQCENNPYASAVLRKHWPDCPNLGDITQADWNGIEKPDLICGGFPVVNLLKGNTSRQLRLVFPHLKQAVRKSLWADGYYVSTAGFVSQSQVKKYIDAQMEHKVIKKPTKEKQRRLTDSPIPPAPKVAGILGGI